MNEHLPKNHPADVLLHTDAIPSVWCPGCAIGTVVATFIEAIKEAQIDPDDLCFVSGIGCTAKALDYLKLKKLEVIGRNILTFAAQFKLENPASKVVVVMNNADFLLASADDFIRFAKTNKPLDIVIIHINNLIYTLSQNGATPNTPFVRNTVAGNLEIPFNIPYFAKLSGARYIARWTPFRAGWLKYSIIEAMSKKGLSVIEVIGPCVMYSPDTDKIGDVVQHIDFYNRSPLLKQEKPIEDLDIRNKPNLIIGKFLDET